MLRWRTRYTPMLVSIALIVVAFANAKAGGGFNWGW
jgi:hypothetical protein